MEHLGGSLFFLVWEVNSYFLTMVFYGPRETYEHFLVLRAARRSMNRQAPTGRTEHPLECFAETRLQKVMEGGNWCLCPYLWNMLLLHS